MKVGFPAREAETSARARPRVCSLAIVVIVSVAIAGLLLRIWFLSGPRGVIDSDEAITALTGRWLFRGDVRTVFFGQGYGRATDVGFGGTLVALPVGISEAIFGVNQFGVHAVFLMLDALTSVLVWRIGARFLTSTQAAFAGLVSWAWPALFVWFGTRAQMYYLSTLVLGLGMVLCTQRALERRSRFADWAGAGLCAGLGWWQAPTIMYLAIPLVVWLLVTAAWRRVPARALVAVPAAIIGALPWIVFNLAHDFPAFPRNNFARGTYLDHLHYFLFYGLPTALGIRAPLFSEWIVDTGHAVLYALVLAALVLALALGVPRGRRDRWSFGTVALVTFPFVFALIPFGSNLAFGRYVGNGRYLFFLAAILPLALAPLVRRQVVVAMVVMGIAMAGTTIWGAERMDDIARTSGLGAVPSLDRLRGFLEHEHLLAVHTPYWVSYRLIVETGERVIAIPWDFGAAYPPYGRAVRRATRPTWVFYAANGDGPRWADEQVARGVGVRRVRAGAYDVVVVLSHRAAVRAPPGDV